ncbi:amylo-alpha-1,6-glucosidase [Flavisolibacter ginsenosidimutans]|uniref:Amylo-alpha-1,6-glucosidase n=1 Tax=Flavisolibacter ginsenosidimutans TaxID=661481 RepID=A0A5B8UDU0_9BACT|nr:amylo-alpha-1,6-glucosidase [Flavisolibacter ginsenosidimutans]QEC54466.1 amylo-alpha-1,6-glucosidase [Flavisolibacter ginsenosidimutans]
MIATKELTTNEKYHVGSESFNYDERTHVMNHIDTFCIFDRWGDIHPKGKKAHGIFYKGTRYLNRLELQLNHKRPVLLSSSVKADNEVLSVDLTNPDIVKCGIKENSVHINRRQFIRNGVFYEEIDLQNFSSATCSFDVTLSFGADFSDIFEIRGMNRLVDVPHPKLSTDKNKIIFDYTGLDEVQRTTEIVFREEQQAVIHKATVAFDLRLEPHQSYKIDYAACFKNSEDGKQKLNEKRSLDEVKNGLLQEIEQTESLFAAVQSSNENFNGWLNRSRIDLQSLLAKTPHGYYPYAGVPWYNTAFGRDGIITAMEVLWVAPQIARDALRFLAATQSKKMDSANDAEPGKIIHEMRHGEMANTGEVPFKQYYGTVDATPLFLMLAGMYYQQTADVETIKKIWPNIKAAVNWIDQYGDVDGDGFVEYKNKSKDGLTNQGWKDSYDAIMYANGELCTAPIALCEVQGYVYAAKKGTAVLAHVMNEKEYAEGLERAASELKNVFNKKFWDKELGAYVLALDGDKKPCKVLASNAGHCLFTGIADDKHAASVAKQFTSKEMFTGWGVRTLAQTEVRYNPMSYHDGSVWPHDNALIAFGLAKYGQTEAALQIMKGLFDASLFIDLQRMPELFCGFERRPNEGPVAYPVACSPQAWAVGVVYLLLQACLQLQVDGVKKIVSFNKPQLPDFLKHLVITRLPVGESFCHFEVYRHKQDVSFHVIEKPADWEVIIRQ